jgi:hypothetical protein
MVIINAHALSKATFVGVTINLKFFENFFKKHFINRKM